MTRQERLNLKLLHDSILKCRLHLHRMQYAAGQLAGLLPFSPENFESLSEAEIGNIDQLIFRYSKLQDEMGTNTFRYLLEYLQEDIKGKPFRDILNILERLEIIDSADTWIFLRELRNDLAHEYPMLTAETVEKLNLLIEQAPVIEAILRLVELKA